MRRSSRRVLVLAVVAAAVLALAARWVRRQGREPSPEERARTKAEQIQEKVRSLTH